MLSLSSTQFGLKKSNLLMLTSISKTCDSNEDPFENAIKEEDRIEKQKLEKDEKLQKFRKNVIERVNAYKNAQKICNEDRKLVIQNKVFDNKTFYKETKLISKKQKQYSRNAASAKKLLASKASTKTDQNVFVEDDFNKNNICSSPDTPTTDIDINSLFLSNIILEEKNNQKSNEEYYKRVYTTRKIFADIEREKAKQYLSKSNNDYTILDLKSKKEKERLEEEAKLDNIDLKNVDIQTLEPKNNEIVAKILIKTSQINDINSNCDNIKRNSNEKISRYVNSNLPALCKCKLIDNSGEYTECANNCIFYKNYKNLQKLHKKLMSTSNAK